MMEQQITQSPCPMCGIRSNTPVGAKAFFCHKCGLAFEPDDGETRDGDTPYGDPSRIAARNDQHAHSQRQKLLGKVPTKTRTLKGGLER